MEKRTGVVGIFISNRKKSAPNVNNILSTYGDLVLGRIGLPFNERANSVICLIVEASTDEMGALTGKLGMLDGVRVKSFLV